VTSRQPATPDPQPALRWPTALWTIDPLVAARRIYLSAEFRLLEEERHHSLGVDLIGQSYVLDLYPDPAIGAVPR
jgi:hypothetical protein